MNGIEFSAVLRKNSQASPVMRFAPLRYETLTVAPAARPYSALWLLVTTRNSPTASGEGCITWFEKPWLLVPYALLSTPSIRKLLNVLRRPFTLNAPSRGVALALELLLSADWRTPVVSSASAEYSRPLSARPRIWSPVITWLRWLVSVSTSGDAAVTRICSLSAAIVIDRSTRSRAATCTCTLSTSAIEKPLFSAETTYTPGRTVLNS